MDKKSLNIPNIDIGQAYDKRFEGADIHIDSLQNLADFFGRDMPAHRHDRFYQIHWIEQGDVRVNIGEQSYRGEGPLFFFTPPAIPHAFSLDEKVVGLVLTLRRELVNRLVSGDNAATLEARFSSPIFLELKAVSGWLQKEAEQLPVMVSHVAREFFGQLPGRKHTLPALINLILVSVFRLSNIPERNGELRQEELKIFTAFNTLIDNHHKEHWSMDRYCKALNVTQSRLADVCRRLSGMSPKALVFENQLEEAKWQLIYTTMAINLISTNLGYKDPAYFCRFFSKHVGMSPREYRRQALQTGGGINI